MNHQTPREHSSPKPEGCKPQKLPPDEKPDVLATDGKPAAKALTAAEQMAQFEEDLKENDWGHQPC